MKAEIHYEPSIMIEWQANERAVIEETLAQFSPRFVDTNINWATHLTGRERTTIYTYSDLLKLNSALAQWSRPEYEDQKDGWFLTTASELFEKTEQILKSTDEELITKMKLHQRLQ